MLIAAVAAVIGGAAATARAGACAHPGLAVVPTGAALVPTNVEIRVVFAAATVEAVELVDEHSRQIAASGAVEAATATVEIRDRAGRAVAATVRRAAASPAPVVLVKPAAPLAPATDYAVVVGSAGASYAVARFTTGAGPDDAAPTLEPPSRVQAYRWRRHRRPHWKDPRGTFAEVTARAGADVVGVEVHTGAAGSIDTLAAVVTPDAAGLIRFGALDPCRRPDVELPAQRAPLPLWIRGFDAAGNLSPLRPIALDLAHPRAR